MVYGLIILWLIILWFWKKNKKMTGIHICAFLGNQNGDGKIQNCAFILRK